MILRGHVKEGKVISNNPRKVQTYVKINQGVRGNKFIKQILITRTKIGDNAFITKIIRGVRGNKM